MNDLSSEKTELRRRTIELQAFIKSNEFCRLNHKDRDLIHRQYSAMSEYGEALQSRIELWHNDGKKEESDFNPEKVNNNHLEGAAPELFIALLLTIQTNNDCSDWLHKMAMSALFKAEPSLKTSISNWSRK